MNKSTFFIVKLCLVVLLNIPFVAKAQLTFAGSVGGTGYSGDVSPIQIQSTRPAIGVDIGYQITNHLQLIGSVNWYHLKAEDKSPYTNRSFTSSNIDAYAQLRFFFTKSKGLYARADGSRIAPYIGGGIGITTIDPRSAAGTSFGTVSLRSMQLEGKSRTIPNTALIIPMSIGIRFKLARSLYLYTDVTVRMAITDLLDGASNGIVFTDRLSDDARAYNLEIAAQKNNVGLANSQYATFYTFKSQPGNADKSYDYWEKNILYKNGDTPLYDFYGTFSFKLEYHLEGNRSGSPYQYKRQGKTGRHGRRPIRVFK
jgi:hypothetical protein